MTWWQILLIILAVILVLLVVLYFVGSKMQKTGRFSRADGCDETNAIHVNYRQKKMKLKDANLPDMVCNRLQSTCAA